MKTLSAFRAWRVDAWEKAKSARVRAEFVRAEDAQRLFAERVKDGYSLVLLLKSGYADRRTRDSGASIWNVMMEHQTGG